MGATKRLFTYKCEAGHRMTKLYPLGTRFDDYDQTTCVECLKNNIVRHTYLIFAEAVLTKEK